MANEAIIRLSVFLSLFVLFAALEALAPRRARDVPRTSRWFTNISMTVLNTIALRAVAIAMPFLAIGAAVDAWRHGWGLLNQMQWPWLVEGLLALLVLDFAIWVQHWLTHKVPLFWRFHRMHHADRDMDVSTGIRFHPVEIAASMGLKIGLIYLLGPMAIAVLVFEVLLNGTTLFNHANLRLPLWLDRAMRLVLVTPDMHRVHHSAQRHEHDSNYGFALSVWDRIFGTYRAQPEGGHDGMVVGLEWQDDKPAKLWWSLLLPFQRK
jgi:sterol desaturase/sphingolipid hydroxylase (fatty acid hydroxylase superfamily)